MQNTNQPGPSQGPNEEMRPFEARLVALERRMAEQLEGRESVRAEERPLERAELAKELEHYRDQLRDYEKALVERIADVDDDRRATASRLQRAWQTHSEEISERLRLHAGLLWGGLMLFAVVFATALFLVYRQASSGQSLLVEEVSEMRARLSSFPESGADKKQASEMLDRLTAEVKEIASAVERMDKGSKQAIGKSVAAERAARGRSEGRLAEEIRGLGTEQRRLARDLSSLRSAVDELQTAGVVKGADAAASMSGAGAGILVKEPGPEPEEVSEGSPEAVVDKPARKDLPAAEEKKEAPGDSEGSDTPAQDDSNAIPSGSEKTRIVDGDVYALQLIGFFNPKSLGEFVTREDLPEQVYSMHRTYQGRDWYVLIHSLHGNLAAAEAAMSRLPAELQALKPWIRPLQEATELQIIETGKASE